VKQWVSVYHGIDLQTYTEVKFGY